jgi:hypothetical protein
VGKYFVECAMMSVWARRPSAVEGRWKRTAMPRGLALGSVSAMVGKPVEEEKRSVREVLGRLKWGAVVSSAAAGVGVNVPVRR